MENTEINFEHALTSLETIVEKLNNESLNLEDALACFEDGVQLARQCKLALNAATQRVQILTGQNTEGDFTTAPFGE
jgi:exodeoxyribonuclease VII small subunit